MDPLTFDDFEPEYTEEEVQEAARWWAIALLAHDIGTLAQRQLEELGQLPQRLFIDKDEMLYKL